VLSDVNADDLFKYFTSIKPDDDFLFNDISKSNSIPVTLTVEDIKFAVNKLKKGGGVPFVQPWLLRDYIDYLAIPLCKIFSSSMNMGYIPRSMKIASITAVPKVKQPADVTDYRPITCASPFLKIIETLVCEKWLKHLFSHVNFSDQFAFVPIKGRGCTTALLSIYGRALKHVDEGKYVNLLMVDFSKAFDRAAISRIVNQLYALKASQQCLLWISNFLQRRTVCVKYNGEVSGFQSISGGTPQGSLISPLLFAALCQSLKPKHSNCLYVKYADDLTVIHNTSKPESIDLQNELVHINQWCEDNLMLINVKKTKVLHIPNRKLPIKPYIHLNNQTVEVVEHAKLLGLMIQSNLKWQAHISSSIGKACKLFFPLLQLRRSNIQVNYLIKIYQSLVRPHLTYACPVTVNMSAQDKNKLIKAERRFLRIINAHHQVPLSVYIDNICLKLVKSIMLNEDHPVRQLLVFVDYQRTRSRRSLNMPIPKTALLRQSFVKFFL